MSSQPVESTHLGEQPCTVFAEGTCADSCAQPEDWCGPCLVRRREHHLPAIEGECASCGEAPNDECPASERPCGHHCNHSWTHDYCDWCGAEFGEEGV
jgi:hypothetical protein